MKNIYRAASVTTLIISALVVLFNYWEIGDEIPIHFNASGEPDDYGSKSTLWILLAIEIGVFLMIDYFSKRPEIANTLVKITDKNKAKQYDLITALLHQTNLLCALLFLIIIHQIFNPITPNYFIHVIIGLMFFVIIVYIVRSLQNK